MLNRRSSWVLFFALVFGLASIASAQSLTHSTRISPVPFGGSAPQGGCGPITVTQSTTNTITSLNSVSCNNGIGHTDNSYWRAFVLADDGILGAFDVCNVQIGVEEAFSGSGTGQPLTVNLYTDAGNDFPAGFPGDLTLIGTTTINLLDQSLTLLDIPVTGTAPAGSQLVVEIFTPDGTAVGNLFFIGSNADPETNPSYLLAADCGIVVPTTTAAIGFPNMHIVMSVIGTESGVALTAVPAALEVDPPIILLPVLTNGVLELGEAAKMVPSWTNTSTEDFTLTGALSNFAGGVALTFSIPDATADYGTILSLAAKDCTTGLPDECYTIQADGVRAAEAAHLDLTIDETVTSVAIPVVQDVMLKTWTLHVGESFTDVANDLANLFYPAVETIWHHGVTAGCGDRIYCPLDNNLRQEMAAFLLKGFLGSTYLPPACTGIFTDVPCPASIDFPYSDFIEDLSIRGITAGCAAGMYCPDREVTRAEMAPFLLKTLLGSAYVPPACTGLFTDVPCPATVDFPFSDWIEDLSIRGITAGCTPTTYCPDLFVTRQEMAAFISITFSLALYGP